MTRNKPYYLEALHTEFVGKDFLELKVKLPGTGLFDFIPNDYLIAYAQGRYKGMRYLLFGVMDLYHTAPCVLPFPPETLECEAAARESSIDNYFRHQQYNFHFLVIIPRFFQVIKAQEETFFCLETGLPGLLATLPVE